MEKIKIKEAIVVEGKYDRIKLSNLFDTVIITTDGFDIYRNKGKMEMLRNIARTNGVIILTDSDAAGLRIRNYIINCLGDIPVKNVYIPQIEGKERRKNTASKEGFLGVEGIRDDIIVDAVMSMTSASSDIRKKITKYDFYCLGLTGGKNSAALRAELAKTMKLPAKISANRLLETANVFYSRKEFEELVYNIKQNSQ